VDSNASNLAELIPHHNHSSLDGLSPVDVLRPNHDKYSLLLCPFLSFLKSDSTPSAPP